MKATQILQYSNINTKSDLPNQAYLNHLMIQHHYAFEFVIYELILACAPLLGVSKIPSKSRAMGYLL